MIKCASQFLCTMRHAFYFHGMSWKQLQRAFDLYNDSRWESLPDEPGTKSRTPEGCKAWLASARNLNQELGIGCTRQPASDCTTKRPIAQMCNQISSTTSRGQFMAHPKEGVAAIYHLIEGNRCLWLFAFWITHTTAAKISAHIILIEDRLFLQSPSDHCQASSEKK